VQTGSDQKQSGLFLGSSLHFQLIVMSATQQKIMCIEKQMDYHKYVISCDFFDSDEKRKAKENLMELIKEISGLKK
jgi:hypothetical protein